MRMMKTHLTARLALSSLLVLCASVASPAQQRRPQTRSRPPVSPPAPTFDNLLAADTYKIYGEVRGVGQLIRSNSVNELLEPVMKIAAPPKEFSTLVKWLNKHADALMTSRMMVAVWPTAKGVPSVLVAIEFANAEEAERFEPQLNDFLPRVLPTPAPAASPENKENRTPEKQESPPPPSYYLSRSGSLIFISPSKLTLKNLRPPDSKLLSEDTHFRTARDRFGSEQIFVFVDFKGIEKQEEETSKRLEEERQKQARQPSSGVTAPPVAEASPEQSTTDPTSVEIAAPSPVPSAEVQPIEAEQKQQQQVDPISLLMGLVATGGSAKWPEAIGVAVSIDNESLDAKVLMVNSPGEKSDSIPIFPILVPGPAITPEGSSILPADTELLVTMSLDWTQIYNRLKKPDTPTIISTRNQPNEAEPLAQFESKLGIKIKDDLLPLLGSEVAVGFPVTRTAVAEAAGSSATTPPRKSEPAPVIAVAIRDKAALKVLLPKIVETLGFKGASAFGQTEKREDTEIVSYANAFAYAFIGNFLVFSPDVANLRLAVESYLKGDTLGGDGSFKNYTRWQPRQLQGQVYLSPAIMESYKTWANEPTALISDQTREFLTRLAFTSQPVTYSLSNDGLGALHELHIPKNLVLMLVASISGETNPSPMLANERQALAAVNMIAGAEIDYRASKGNGSYATLDQLIAEKDYLKSLLQNPGYKIDLTLAGNHFEVSAVPVEYGKTGRISYFTDETQIIRGGDLSGVPATATSKPIVP